MMKSQWLGFLAILFSVAACAPLSYEATYRPPSGHATVYNAHYQKEPSRTYIRPIQVTLYSDSTYLGVNFQPIQVVISDGEYVAIPVRNRRGRSSQFFAHYHQGSLHFDAKRKCQKIQGSTGYQYDRRWDKGYKYTHVNAGHDYDFTGLRLVIRNTPKTDNRPGQVLNTKSHMIHKKTLIADKYQPFSYNSKNLNDKKTVPHKQLKKVKSKVVVATKTSKPIKQLSRDKHVDAQGKTMANRTGEAKKLFVPDIVRDVSRHDKANKIVAKERRNGLKLSNTPAGKLSVAAQGNHSANAIKRQQANSQRKSMNKARGVYQANQDKSM